MAPVLPPSTTTSCTTISCTDCVMLHTEACDDCVVTFICDRAPDDAVVIDVAEARAVRLLAGAGLVPQLRHQLRQEGGVR
jgi:hypothetical protein